MMEDEIEDLVGDVMYTDSQKSVTTSIVYSFDFTDCSPDRNNSTGQETYIIECDDSDFSEKTFQRQENGNPLGLDETELSTILSRNYNLQSNRKQTLKKSVCTSYQKISIVAKETFTQTSKTIIELFQGDPHKTDECRTLETQTSFVSVNENRSSEYRIDLIRANAGLDRTDVSDLNINNNIIENLTSRVESHPILANSLEDKSSIYRESETDNDLPSRNSSNDTMIRFIDDESKENLIESKNETQYENTSVYELSTFDSDVEEDSLMENEYNENKIYVDDASDTSEVEVVDNDVEDLYNELSERPILFLPVTLEPESRQFGILTPVTEETSLKKEIIIDVTPSERTLTNINKHDDKKQITEENILKLPPINKYQSCPNSPHLNVLFSVNTSHKSIALDDPGPYSYETQDSKFVDRWEISRRELASGESPLINGRNDDLRLRSEHIQLPPIHLEGVFHNTSKRKDIPIKFKRLSKDYDSISITGKIRELKMIAHKPKQKMDSRSVSPTSTASPPETKLYNVAEKGCDALCMELLRRLRSSAWLEITETLENLPKALDTFWFVITENRIATLLRQVTAHVESPRTQVAKAACSTLADILRNTNYTKKPDFFEAISTLLTKTGSFNRSVRRAANVALDDVVCSVDITQTVTAICVYGVGHRSAAVRCSSARLLVVCSALAGGGRRVLRDRPRSAAAARTHALRALALLLRDNNTDTRRSTFRGVTVSAKAIPGRPIMAMRATVGFLVGRLKNGSVIYAAGRPTYLPAIAFLADVTMRKYAERLYMMLRPWPNFEAYFLTDVDAELATQHMKKYDQLLCNKQTR